MRYAASWLSIPFYVVGQATASALSSIRTTYHTPYAPGVILGESSGTGEHLANFILSSEGISRLKKVLYLTGDKNRDTVPRILGQAGVVVSPVKVYETQFSSNFAQDLQDALQSASKRLCLPSQSRIIDHLAFIAEHDQWWIVHFAPSSAKSATPILRHHFDLDLLDSSPELEALTSAPRPTAVPATARIASIGRVTTSFLQEELKIHVHATASSPTPQDLVAAIVAYDRGAGVLGEISHDSTQP